VVMLWWKAKNTVQTSHGVSQEGRKDAGILPPFLGLCFLAIEQRYEYPRLAYGANSPQRAEDHGNESRKFLVSCTRERTPCAVEHREAHRGNLKVSTRRRPYKKAISQGS
jgi:hypothetical protein